MIPILYDKEETDFTNNGLCELRDAASVIVTEERNGVYECDFEFPVNGANFDLIQIGRIIVVKHDSTNGVQPFDIVSCTKPINGVVSFHAVHISYRQSKIVASGKNITGLDAALDMLKGGEPSNPFVYWTDKASGATFPLGDGIPRSVREMLGGTDGSILDTYGGEFEFDWFDVKLWENRGEDVDFSIRYGLNMTDYEDQTDISESYSAIVAYWLGSGENNEQIVIKTPMVYDGTPSVTGRVECVAMDLSSDFESQPTEADLASAALNVLATKQPSLPSQTITVDFINLDQTGEYDHLRSLLRCKLCDRVRVVFPFYKLDSYFKIVKVTYDVLQERYTSMELGTLSTTLSEALGIGSGTSGSGSSGGGGITVLDWYPVGSYYETSDTSFDPNSAWGGTWVLDSKGRVTVGRDETIADFNTVGKTGGEKTHTLTVDEMPNHHHTLSLWNNGQHYSPTSGNLFQWYSSAYGQQTANTSDVGGGQAHNNMPPYVVVNRWHRTA